MTEHEAISDEQIKAILWRANNACSYADYRQVVHDLRTLATEAKRARAELAELRARLGTPVTEWGVHGFLDIAGNRTDIPMSEADARDCIEDCRKLGHDMANWLLITRERYETPWREAERASVAEPDIATSELLYLTTDPNEVPLVMPAWAREVPELAAAIDEGRERRRNSAALREWRERHGGIDVDETPARRDSGSAIDSEPT